MRLAAKILFCLSTFIAFGNTTTNAALDHGIDPANLGTGDWIYVLRDATNRLGGNAESVTNVQSLMRFYKKSGVNFICVKAGTGGAEFPSAAQPQFTKGLVDAAHKYGVKIFGYTRSDGKDVPGEIALAAKVYDLGADGFIIDAEAEWEHSRLGDKGPGLAIQLCSEIKRLYPNKFLGHSPFPIISKHASFPYVEFGLYCDAVMPQAYWKSIGVTPQRMVEWMDQEWHAWQKSLKGSEKAAIKPLAPIGQGWSPDKEKILKGEEIVDFVDALNRSRNPASITGYKGISYWRTDLHTPGMWRAIRNAKIGEPKSEGDAPSPDADATIVNVPPKAEENEIVIDNVHPDANFSGAWYFAKQRLGYGTNYLCAKAVAQDPTATMVFRPAINETANYDVYIWYVANGNRSKKVPCFVSCSSGTEIVEVDQTIEAGGWRLIARERLFEVGNEGYVSISNDTGESSEHVIVADAVRFVRQDPAKKEAGQ